MEISLCIPNVKTNMYRIHDKAYVSLQVHSEARDNKKTVFHIKYFNIQPCPEASKRTLAARPNSTEEQEDEIENDATENCK